MQRYGSPADVFIASILTRQWAKKHAAELGVDVTIPLEAGSR